MEREKFKKWGCGWTVIGVVGFFAVVLGAFGAHVLEARFDAATAQVYHTAVQYHFYHTFALALTWFLYEKFACKEFWFSFCFFMTGIFLFSGSLYAYAIFSLRWLGMITPLGGICFLIGWILIALGGRKIR